MVSKSHTRTFLQPSGIKNKGNTCFFNATLQSLLSLSPFLFYFKENTFNPSNCPISYALREFIYDYQNHKVADPSALIRSMKAKIKLFNGNQQDAHCFLELFLTALIEEQGSTPNKLSNIFKILNEDIVRCQMCNYSNVILNEMNDRYLFIENSVKKSLDKYLNLIDTVSEDSPWLCPECNKSNQATIKHTIREASDIFIIHLQRFEGINTKNNREISIDANIKIAGNDYKNIAVVCHIGSLNSGHYFAKGKRDKEWYELNDSVTKKTSYSFDKNTPYLLFYQIKKSKI